MTAESTSGSSRVEDATVHVVDDDASFREAVRRRLVVAGYGIRTYASGSEFLAEAPLAAPGCVLADLRMPGIDGLDLQRRLAEAGSVLPVVFLSGHGDVPTTVRAMHGGTASRSPWSKSR